MQKLRHRTVPGIFHQSARTEPDGGAGNYLSIFLGNKQTAIVLCSLEYLPLQLVGIFEELLHRAPGIVHLIKCVEILSRASFRNLNSILCRQLYIPAMSCAELLQQGVGA